MKNEISLKNQKVEYELRRSKRSRHMRLAVYCGGSLVVTAPENLNFSKIENFILAKAEWVLEKIGIMVKRKKSIVLAGSDKREYKKLKNQALALAKIKVEKFNKIYDLKYAKITIRNQKTRWGSCSKKGNLNFNYKIALLPEDLADYIIVHELCHLKEFNHSKNFWDLVSVAIPDYRQKRKKIKSL